MCGIFGLLKFSGSSITDNDLEQSRHACALLERRGPDDEGFWSSHHTVFAFRRLAILDLSPAGHQPMLSPDGNYSLIFNGELYNYKDLKAELEKRGRTFRSRSDTEVVLQSLIEWGTAALPRFNGMFALAFWNGLEKSVLIARDHVGMKPLYYSRTDTRFLFGSQLDTIMLFHEKKNLSLDKNGLALFLSVGYYPSPRTVFEEIKMLEAGTWMKVKTTGKIQKGSHFNLLDFHAENIENILNPSDLKEHLRQAVSRHLMSDVPIGTFLSGGLDSGIINGLMKELGSDFTAYTLSNPGTPFDEAERATQVAKYLGIKHRIIRPENIVEAVKLFQKAYQEPFGDYSAIPSMMVTAEAKKEVKVMLSGDGSDEFFFGYNRMTTMLQSGGLYKYPLWLRRVMKKVKPSLPALTWSDIGEMVFRRQSFGSEETLRNIGVDVEELSDEFMAPLTPPYALPADLTIKLNTIYRYFQLQLLKLDRATMYNSIEARVPFADKDLMRFTIAYSAKEATKNGYQTRKVPLQQIYSELYPLMPPEKGPKRGFTIDMEAMLSNELKDYYIGLLETPSLFSSLIDLHQIKEDFIRGKQLNTFSNWFLFSLQTWSMNYVRN